MVQVRPQPTASAPSSLCSKNVKQSVLLYHPLILPRGHFTEHLPLDLQPVHSKITRITHNSPSSHVLHEEMRRWPRRLRSPFGWWFWYRCHDEGGFGFPPPIASPRKIKHEAQRGHALARSHVLRCTFLAQSSRPTHSERAQLVEDPV